MKKFKLAYWVSNGGDGSANVHFCKTLENAKKKCEAQDEGWGESSAGTQTIVYHNGKLYFEKSRWDGKEHRTIKVEIPSDS